MSVRTVRGSEASEAAALSVLPARPELLGAKRRLYERALVLFAERGYHAVSVRDLMSDLGQQAGALYAHVSSKQQLLFELINIGYEEHRDWLRAELLNSGADPADQLRAVVRGHVGVHLAYPELAKVTSREARSLTDAETVLVMAVRSESERVFLDVIERGMRLGDFTTTVPTPLAMLAIAGMGIRAAEWWSDAVPYTAEEVIETYADFAVKLLA